MVAKQQARSTATTNRAHAVTPPASEVTRPARGQQVATREPKSGSAVAIAEDFNTLPDFMVGDAGRGTEHIGRSDMEIPRLKLISSVSPELQQFDELRPGMFYHTASDDILEGPFDIVPLYIDKRYILWNPRDSGGGILARADDAIHWQPANVEFTVKLDKKDGGATVKWKTADTVARSGLAEWGTMNPADPQSQPAATESYNMVVAFPARPDLLPAVFTFQRGSIRVGRKLNTKLKTVRAPIFGIIVEMSSEVDQNSRNQDFHVPKCVAKGLIKIRGLYDEYKQIHESFLEKGLEIKDLETAQDEGRAPEDDKDDDKGKPSY